MTRVAPTAPAVSRNSRRETRAGPLMSHSLRRAVNRRADPLVRAAATDISDLGVDLRVARVGRLREQRGDGHDLPRLAIAALRHVFLDPGPLHSVRAVLREAFDRGHAL